VQRDVGRYKNYTILYFVFEKEWRCEQYPPNGNVTFYDIAVEYDNKPVSNYRSILGLDVAVRSQY
jgi:hypothetical protein